MEHSPSALSLPRAGRGADGSPNTADPTTVPTAGDRLLHNGCIEALPSTTADMVVVPLAGTLANLEQKVLTLAVCQQEAESGIVPPEALQQAEASVATAAHQALRKSRPMVSALRRLKRHLERDTAPQF